MAAGRPSHFKTAALLKERIEEYFEWIKGDFDMVDALDPFGNPVIQKVYSRDPEHPAITGLALFLGFESRQSIYDYEKNGKFSYTIKTARLKVESAYEQALHSKSYPGAIFALKNFGWSDKQEIDHTSKGESIKPTPIVFTSGSNE